MATAERLFCRAAAGYLRDTHLPRLVRAIEALPEGEIWWRPHEDALAAGTILLHLEGNVRQWILSGIGGADDRRDRAAEFAAREGPPAAELLARLTATVGDAATLVEGLSAERLVEPLVIQGFDTTVLEAVLHVVEHFAWHTGQAVWIAKARGGAGHGIRFFDDAAINAARNKGARR